MTAASPDMGVRTSRWAEAWRDLTQSLRLTPFWMRLAYQRVRGRYQRLSLGLIWHPLSYAFVVISLGYMWAAIMGREASYFMPYVAVGFATWFFISNAISGATDIFNSARRHIMARPTPLMMFIFERTAANLMAFFLEAPLFFLVALLVGRDFGWIVLLALPGLGLLILNAIWANLFFAIAVARFPDLGEMVRNIMRIAFFFTPIIWSVDVNPRVENVSQWNPFYHAVEGVRAPFMGAPPDRISYIVVSAIAAVGLTLTIPMFVYARRRVPYWV